MAQSKSDDDVITRERKRVQREAYFQYGGMLILVVLAGWTYFPALETWRLAASPYDYYIMAACIAAFLVYGFVFVGWPSVAARSERLIPRQIDGYLARARWQWLFLVVALLGGVASTSKMIAGVDEGIRVHRLPADYIVTHNGIFGPAAMAFCFILCSLSFALPFTWFRRAYNQVLQDELVREIRAKAIKIGYIGAVIAMTAGYVVMSVTTINPLQWMVWSGYAVVALPILAYAALEAWAGRSE
jgi:hypothetical protein